MKKTSSIIAYIVLGLWAAFTTAIIVMVIAASLSTTPEIFKGKLLNSGFHFENFVNAWKLQNISKYFANSLIYSVIATVLAILISTPCAYTLARMKFKWNKVIQSSFAAAQGVPLVMIVLPLYGIVARLGLLESSGKIMVTMIILYTAIRIPYTVIFLLSYFVTLPASFEEAAYIDGCTRQQAFWKIMFPLAQSGIITVSVFNFLGTWNEYFMSMIFASGEEVRSISVGLYSLYNSMKYTGNWAGLFASIVIVFLPTFILYVILSNKIIAGITQGGVKG